jgi:hypothetical protein
MVLVPTDSAVAVWWVSRQIRGNWNTVVMVLGVAVSLIRRQVGKVYLLSR